MSTQLPLRLPVDASANLLDDFVGDAANRLSELSGLVLVSGETGTGKSHLLQGCCHAAIASGNRAIYLPRLAHLDPEVLEGFNLYDLVCLDNIDTVLDDHDWQVALYQLINDMKETGGSLVLSASASADNLQIDLADLKSRLTGSYLVNTSQLSDDDKLKVIRLKAARRGFDMSDEVCRFILGRAQRDMHHLARLVERLDAETIRRQKKVTIPFVKEALDL